jgi:hypothetical protein
MTGRRRQLSGTAASEDEATALEAELRRRAAGDTTGDPSMAALIEERWSSNPRQAATTRVSYRQLLDRHVLPWIGDRSVSEMRPRLIAKLLAHLAGEGLGSGTCRKVRTVLSSVMSFAAPMSTSSRTWWPRAVIR